MSEVLHVQELIAFPQDHVSCVAQLILLTHIAHVKQLLIVEEEERA